MTDRAEIERLLNQTGRTLEGLPNSYSSTERAGRWSEIVGNRIYGDVVLHQSDVIELLVAALRDALEKPMQRPLTLEEISEISPDNLVWQERKGETRSYFERMNPAVFMLLYNTNKGDNFYRYGHAVRLWKKMPSDEEMEAAKWES